MRRDEAYLLDILIAANKALKFVDGIDRNEFEDNEIIQNAVMRPLEIKECLMSWACRTVSPRSAQRTRRKTF